MVPKIPSCHYMLLMQPSLLKFICNQFHIFIHVKEPLPLGDNPITVNKYYYYYYYYCLHGEKFFFKI